MEEAKKLGINKMKELLKDKIEKFQKAIEQLKNNLIHNRRKKDHGTHDK